MDRIEKLISEFEDKLHFVFRKDMPDNLGGLIINNTIYLNDNLSKDQAYAILAEEIGHYQTSSDKDISDYMTMQNRKEEVKARKWGYKRLISSDDLVKYKKSQDPIYSYEIAEELHLPQAFVEETITMYKKEGKL